MISEKYVVSFNRITDYYHTPCEPYTVYLSDAMSSKNLQDAVLFNSQEEAIAALKHKYYILFGAPLMLKDYDFSSTKLLKFKCTEEEPIANLFADFDKEYEKTAFKKYVEDIATGEYTGFSYIQFFTDEQVRYICAIIDSIDKSLRMFETGKNKIKMFADTTFRNSRRKRKKYIEKVKKYWEISR